LRKIQQSDSPFQLFAASPAIHKREQATTKLAFLCSTLHRYTPRLLFSPHRHRPLTTDPTPQPGLSVHLGNPNQPSQPIKKITVTMSAWDTETVKIGKNANRGASARETVVRGQAALNAARRAGSAITTEKKFATGNAVRRPPN
jgi:hypothetical protein